VERDSQFTEGMRTGGPHLMIDLSQYLQENPNLVNVQKEAEVRIKGNFTCEGKV